MNDLIPIAKTRGEVLFHGQNIYREGVDPVEVRKRIGMVFQKPNPFPKSIYENIAWGARINGFKGKKSNLDDLVEQTLHGAALWEEVKDKLQDSGLLTFRRTAATLMYCQSHRRRTRYNADG